MLCEFEGSVAFDCGGSWNALVEADIEPFCVIVVSASLGCKRESYGDGMRYVSTFPVLFIPCCVA